MPNKGNFLTRFWRELKRRNVHRSLAVYAGSAYIIFEASTLIFPRWGLPEWAIDVVLYLLIFGAAVTFAVSWIFDLSPEGIVKTSSVEEDTTGQKKASSSSWRVATFASLFVIVALIVFNVFNRNRFSNAFLDLEKSVAVLPFENLFPDSSELWFTDGISDVIINQLGKISGLRVINRISTQKYRDERRSLQEIGKELGVSYVIDGSVQKQDEKIRVIVQLTLIENETQLWSDLYDREWKDIFDIQTDIARSIAMNMEAVLSPDETERIENIGTENSDAWEYYLKGNHLMTRWNESAFRRAMDNYQRAIDLDPEFAQAYAGMAMATYELTSWDVPVPDLTLIPEASEWAHRAISIDESLGDPYYVLGSIKCMHEWDWEEAEKAYRMGMELNPNNVWGRISYANMLSMMRRFEESIAISELTVKLNPLDPAVYIELGFAKWLKGQKEEAAELYNKSLELDPESEAANALLFQYYLELGMQNQFVSDYLNNMMGAHDNDIRKVYSFDLFLLSKYYASSDQKDSLNMVLNECFRRTESGEGSYYSGIGGIYYALGDTEKAIDFFEKSFKVREPFMYTINADIDLVPLRSHPRFQELILKLGFDI
jgi:TolB-like protein/Tfp pilus assembly protein PilF